MSGPIARVYAFSFFDAFILIYPLDRKSVV